MPPKITITQEDILQAAFSITRQSGYGAVNARSIAKELGCSTHPIFRVYANMPDLRRDLLQYIEDYYNRFVSSRFEEKDLFFSIGKAYIEFAKCESNLFHMIFMSHNFVLNDFMELIEGEDNKPIILAISEAARVDEEKAKDLYLKTWLFTHGIASMISTNNIRLTDIQIEKLLKEAFSSFLKLYAK